MKPVKFNELQDTMYMKQETTAYQKSPSSIIFNEDHVEDLNISELNCDKSDDCDELESEEEYVLVGDTTSRKVCQQQKYLCYWEQVI